jgi:hypothetical protein
MMVFSNSTTMSNVLEMALGDMVVPVLDDGVQKFHKHMKSTGDGIRRYDDPSAR